MNKEKQVKKTAQIKGEVYAAEDSLISNGVSCMAKGQAIYIGSGAVIMDNSQITSTEDFPVKIGQKVIVGQSCKINGANIGNFCEIGNNVQIGEGAYIGDYAILEEGCVLPNGAKVPSRAVATGDPFSVVRGLTIEDFDKIKERCQGDVSLSSLALEKLEEQ